MKKRKLFIIISFVILLVSVLLYICFKPRNQGLYKVTILPSLGGNFTLPYSINDKGQVAGHSQISRGVEHLFIWDKENGIQDLGLAVQGNIYINNSSQIAADMTDPNGIHCAFILNPDTGRTFLPLSGGKYSDVRGLNNNGQIIGWIDTSAGIKHTYIWDKINGMRDLTPDNQKGAYAYSINDSGQVVVKDSDTNTALLIETENELTITSIPDKIAGWPQINNNGLITTFSYSEQKKFDVVSWHPDSGLKKLFSLNTGTFPKINDHDQIIITDEGDFNIFHKFLPTHNKNYMLDPKIGPISLDGYISLRKNENLSLMDINNNGCIIGAIQSTNNSKSVGVLFEPIPEKWKKFQKSSLSD